MPLKISTSPTQCMYMFLTIIRTNREHLPTALVKRSAYVVEMEVFLCQNAPEFFMCFCLNFCLKYFKKRMKEAVPLIAVS